MGKFRFGRIGSQRNKNQPVNISGRDLESMV